MPRNTLLIGKIETKQILFEKILDNSYKTLSTILSSLDRYFEQNFNSKHRIYYRNERSLFIALTIWTIFGSTEQREINGVKSWRKINRGDKSPISDNDGKIKIAFS